MSKSNWVRINDEVYNLSKLNEIFWHNGKTVLTDGQYEAYIIDPDKRIFEKFITAIILDENLMDFME